MTNKQKRFCEEYIVDMNATEAAKRAGYSEKTAYSIGNENLNKPEIQNYIQELTDQMKADSIASAEEVLQYLTSVLRGDEMDEAIVTESVGDGMSEARRMNKKVNARDKIKAAELLAKRYGLLTEKVNVDGNGTVILIDDVGEGHD